MAERISLHGAVESNGSAIAPWRSTVSLRRVHQLSANSSTAS